jgi:hypothetical protein
LKQGITTGIKNALSRGSVHSMCKDCGFPLPRYPGRYPKTCPSCGEERHPETPHESVEEVSLAPGLVPDIGDTVTLDERTATVVYVDEEAAYLEFEDGEELTLPLR